MKLRYNRVSDNLLLILKKLMAAQAFHDFRLVGGTALSMQRGHRRSIDIDLFTDIDYGQMPLGQIKDFLETEFALHLGTDSLNETSLGYNIRIGEENQMPIKVDLFYTDKFLFPYKEVDGIRLADEKEIAAMKLEVIGRLALRQKDYWDIHELLQDYSLKEMISWALQRCAYSLTETEIISGLKHVDKIKESTEGIDALRPLDYWELKVLDLKYAVKEYLRTKGS